MTEFQPSVPQYYTAMNLIGNIYDKLKWYDLAEECYLKASTKIVIAKYNYASLFLMRGKSREVAIDLLNEYVACNPDDSDGYRELAKAYGWKNRDKRHEMYEKAFQKGWYGDFFEMILYNIEHQEKDIAQEKNNMIADTMYSVIVEFDDLKTEEEKNERKKMLSARVCNQLGLIIFQGKYFIKQDYNRACKIWEVTIKMHDNTENLQTKDNIVCTKYNLALSYQKGEGVDRDVSKAFELLMQCPEDPDAQREIGSYYKDLEKNKEKAKEWYIKAANNKYPDYESCLCLARLYEEIPVKEKAMYFLKGIKRESQIKMDNKLKSYNIPTDVLLYYDKKISKMTAKINEIECRPPGQPGEMYLQAQTRFEEAIKRM